MTENKNGLKHSELAEYCELSYEVHTHIALETEAYVQSHGEFTVIAFTGTQASWLWPWYATVDGIKNWRDITSDLNVIRYRHPEFGRIHRGFMKGAMCWCEKFKNDFSKDTPLVITGHSKGAAEAAQVARLLKTEGYNISEVVLFGEPPSHYIKSRKHYDSLNIPTFSYIYKNDIIRILPPWGKPSSKLIQLGKKNWYRYTWFDHSIDYYIEAIKNVEKN